MKCHTGGWNKNVTLQILSSVTGILSIKRRSINNSTCMLNSLNEGEMI